MVNLFGGLIRSGIVSATLSAWQKLPADEVACVDQNLRREGFSLNSAIQQGIGPTDPRMLDARSACRGRGPQQTVRAGPSFDCAKANYADEFAICSNPELSQLDGQVVAAYDYVRGHGGEQAARATRDRSLRARRSCGPDIGCIKRVQIEAIKDYQRLGAPSDAGPAIAAAHPEYVVDGLALGNKVVFGSAAYREYQCRPSDQFGGFFFCQKQRQMQEARGAYTSSNTILHAADGTAVYVNRSLEPAFFDADEAKSDVEARSKRYGNPAHVIPMPATSAVPNGMIVSWGDVSLEPVDVATTKALADGRGVRVGFMIDHIGNLRRSASMGLPIYRMRGGAGYVWAASWNDNGIGTLQFLTIDASRFMQPDSAVPADPSLGPPASAPAASANVTPGAVLPRDPSSIPPTTPTAPSAAKVPITPEQARVRIKAGLDRITSQRNTLPNEAFKVRLDMIAAKLATVNDQMDADALKGLLRECDAEDAIFSEAAEFRRTSEVATRAVAIIKTRLDTINFDAPLVHDIKAALSSVNNALAEADIKTLQQALSELNSVYDANKLDRLVDAKAHGFDTIESYDDFKERQSKLGKSGIRLNEK
ncbi:hypothetical protein H8B02_13315 [Bradyrhizobium sp. Pear77]|uniref:lysozyme inhibitor LprI family protein n=1 Tax=Bradyrhizobium altum TaxID=1571202 RepID=UPI001E2CD3BC|nr:hypothetical protein [Bradyrhizobium altum]MCC8954392.1 hypothetical protein [Bradyrhizobium altum]